MVVQHHFDSYGTQSNRYNQNSAIFLICYCYESYLSPFYYVEISHYWTLQDFPQTSPGCPTMTKPIFDNCTGPCQVENYLHWLIFAVDFQPYMCTIHIQINTNVYNEYISHNKPLYVIYCVRFWYPSQNCTRMDFWLYLGLYLQYRQVSTHFGMLV